MLTGSGSGGQRSLGKHSSLGSGSKSGSGGRRSVHSGGSMESAVSSVTRQMNMLLRTKSDSGKKLSDEASRLLFN